jgi:hypothetical protein
MKLTSVIFLAVAVLLPRARYVCVLLVLLAQILQCCQVSMQLLKTIWEHRLSATNSTTKPCVTPWT